MPIATAVEGCDDDETSWEWTWEEEEEDEAQTDGEYNITYDDYDTYFDYMVSRDSLLSNYSHLP